MNQYDDLSIILTWNCAFYEKQKYQSSIENGILKALFNFPSHRCKGFVSDCPLQTSSGHRVNITDRCPFNFMDLFSRTRPDQRKMYHFITPFDIQ